MGHTFINPVVSINKVLFIHLTQSWAIPLIVYQVTDKPEGCDLCDTNKIVCNIKQFNYY